MDQNRSDNPSTQQQNVHLHMHHVCNCQGSVYPTYYPAVSYRQPVPPLVTYPPPPVPRPYLQHYQYTQFNMGSQYSVPISPVATSGTVYGTTTPASDAAITNITRERKDKGDSQEGSSDDRINDTSGYEYGQVTPPASEFLLTDGSESISPENFVKFLERSCLTAEQIAYRNRNRPCFRNIQNLCIRTRSEILKPCTTISNIHSQGIPWATKDFIYAFVRLTNCWHILKGYWENRDGSSLGKIEKELTPEFRACYVRWEKETMELAAQLTKVFYNLDTNLVSPQANVVKNSAAETNNKKIPANESISTPTLTNVSMNNTSKNVRGIIHLPSVPVTETVDQANQTYSGDFCTTKEEGYDSEEERRVYMKPGSYNVPKKDSNDGATNSPRAIEFLETAQNVNKAQAANDRYWANVNINNVKKSSDSKALQEINSESELELSLSSHVSVHEWLLNSNFSDFGEPSPVSSSAQEIRPPFFVDNAGLYETLPAVDADVQKGAVVRALHQRNRFNATIEPRNEKDITANGQYQVMNSRTFLSCNNSTAVMFEVGEDGITDEGIIILEKLLNELKKYNVLEGLEDADKNSFTPIVDIDAILAKLKNEEYIYVNEIIRDLRYLMNYYSLFAEKFTNKKKKEMIIFITEMFSLMVRNFLAEYLSAYDFNDIKGDLLQEVGSLKSKFTKFLGRDEDQYL